MAITVVGAGTADSTSPWVPPLHASTAENDIILILVEQASLTSPEATPAATGYAHVLGSPVGPDSAGTVLSVLWKRAGASESAPTVTGPSNHAMTRTVSIRGVKTSGNPWNVSPAVAVDAAASTTATWSSVTTTAADCLIVLCISTGRDNNSTANLGAVTNANLSSLTEYMDNWTASGTGGGVGLVTGTKASAGAVGTSTATMGTTDGKALMTLPLEPVAATNLVIADAAHSHTADNIALTQTHQLVIADAAHGQTVDNAVLTQVHVLTIAETVQAHSADNVVLEVSSATDLVIQDASHTQTTDSLALTQVHSLAVADATHAHAADPLTLTQAHNLQPADAVHAQAADTLALTQAHTLAIQDASHSHTADQCQVNSATQLVIADATHAHAADPLTLTQVHVLTVADAVQAHLADLLALTQIHDLTVADAAHAHAADNIQLGSGDLVDLVVASAQHQHTAAQVKLTTHLTPAPKISTRAGTPVHVPGVRSRTVQRSGVA